MDYRKVPKKVILSGNRDEAAKRIGIANSLLNLCEIQAGFQGLQQYTMTRQFNDGTIIQAIKCFGLSIVKIFCPPLAIPVEVEEELEVCVLGPEMYFPWHYTIKLETDNKIYYIVREDYIELELPFSKVFVDEDKDKNEGPLDESWEDNFDGSSEIVTFSEGEMIFFLTAYNNIPEAWTFLQENPEHPLSSEYDEESPETVRPRAISPFREQPSCLGWLERIISINNKVNNWEFDEEISDWMIMDSETPGGEIACALTKLQLLHEAGIDEHAMDLLFFDEDKVLAIVSFPEGVLYLDAPNRKKGMTKESPHTILKEEDYPDPWLFSRVWPESFWALMGKVEDVEEDEFKGVEPEDLPDYWEVAEEGVTKVELQSSIVDPKRFGLFTPEYEDEEE